MLLFDWRQLVKSPPLCATGGHPRVLHPEGEEAEHGAAGPERALHPHQ